MAVGYDPDRVRILARHTRGAIEAIGSVRSTDPAAAGAWRALRLLRLTLEEHWMPALIEIERSEAMTSWSPSALDSWSLGGRSVATERSPARHRRPTTDQCAWTPLSPSSDGDVLDLVTRTDRLLLTRTPPPDDELDLLAAELAARSSRDPAFGDRLAEIAAATPLIGILTGRTRFPSEVAVAVVRSMMRPSGPFTTVELDHYAHALSAALGSLVDDPGACLDLLQDPEVLHGLASWERLDPDVVTAFAVAGLHTSVGTHPQRLADGYEVLTELTKLVNGPLDRGIQPAMALGVAAAMTGYIETLAPAIRQEGSYPVLVVGTGFEAEMGTYDDLVDLFGSLLRDPPAQAVLGTVLSAYTTEIVTDLGAEITTAPGLVHVARFADLIADASRTEQVEMLMQAAAEEARQRQFGSLVGFGVTVALAESGLGPISGTLVSMAVSMAADRAAQVEAGALPDARIPSHTYDLVTVAVLRILSTDRTERTRAGLQRVGARDWDEVAHRLDEIDEEADIDERTRRILRLDHWIEAEVPQLAGYLGRVRSVPGMAELAESRNAVNTD